MLRELGILTKIQIRKERQQTSKMQKAKKKKITSNAELMKRAREVNDYDIKLYDLAKRKFCSTISKYSDLKARLEKTEIKCKF